MKGNTWQLQEAKSKFSQLVENAMHGEPQFVTRHGSNAVVVLSIADYERMSRPDTDLITFLRSSPLAEAELTITRNKDLPRDVPL